MPNYLEPFVRPLPALERGYPLIPMGVVVPTGTNAGRFVVVWTGVDESTWPATDDMNVYTAYTDDLGVTWSAPALVGTPSTRHQFHPWMTADPLSGALYLSFYDTRNDPGNQITQRFSAASVNGATWGLPLLLAQGSSDAVPGGGNDYLEYCGIAAYGRCVYTCWADNSDVNGDNPDGPGPGDGFDVYTTLFLQKP